MNILGRSARTATVVLGLTAVILSPPAGADIVHLDDVIINGGDSGSLCIGLDCVNGESFGFDTLRLKENNLRIRFQDTSTTSSFPGDDWQITANDSFDGGLEKFSIDHLDSARTPFTIEGNAGNHSIYIDNTGKVGFSTNNPVVELHSVDGDTPTLRLEQDGSLGFTPQTWDVAGNDANFFVRDATNGSRLPFRIRPGAPSNSIYVDFDGDVGIGTASPSAKIHVTGDATIDGNLSVGSSRKMKNDLGVVDGSDLLSRLSGLPIHNWRYLTEPEEVSHIGPMAEDFHAAFGLNPDAERLSLVDSTGLALAGVQELHSQLHARDQEIADLRSRLAALEARMEP